MSKLLVAKCILHSKYVSIERYVHELELVLGGRFSMFLFNIIPFGHLYNVSWSLDGDQRTQLLIIINCDKSFKFQKTEDRNFHICTVVRIRQHLHWISGICASIFINVSLRSDNQIVETKNKKKANNLARSKGIHAGVSVWTIVRRFTAKKCICKI